jgi:hypothetical protein
MSAIAAGPPVQAPAVDFCFRRIRQPAAPKPRIIIAQIVGSGTAVTGPSPASP